MKPFHEIERIVGQLCQQQRAIMAAYVFGSVSQGKVRDTSDIDVAVLLDNKALSDFSLLGFMTQLEQVLKWNVDVVVLNTASEILKHEVRKSGYVVFDRAPRFRKRFEILSRKAYEDFLYLHRRYVQKVLYA